MSPLGSEILSTGICNSGFSWSAQLQTCSLAPDPYWSTYTVALLHLDGANNSTTMTDVKGHTFTRSGTAAISTAQSKFGNSSLNLTAANAYISAGNSTDWNFASGDFTVEAWIYPTSYPTADASNAYVSYLFYKGSASGNAPWSIYLGGTSSSFTTLALYGYDGSVASGSGIGANIQLNNWYHIAVMRESGVYKFAVNGIVTTGSAGGPISFATATDNLKIGESYMSSYTRHFYGYMDEIRITKGVARYPANFSPAEGAYPGY